MLDHRKLRTPGREVLEVPTEPLALAVAGEWASQGELLQPSIMHLVSQSEREIPTHCERILCFSPQTALCNTVLDNPHQTTSASNVDTLLSRVHTDTLL